MAPGDLIEVIGALRRRRLVIDRLVCRYLADLADRIGQDPGGPMCGGYWDVFEVSERILGLSVRQTRERVRVGRAIRLLPRIEQALERGDMSFARVREITRIARPDNEAIWLELGRSLPIRELQRRVAEAGARSAGRDARRRDHLMSPSPMSPSLGDSAPVSPSPGNSASANSPPTTRPTANSGHVRVVLDLPTSDWILLQKALQTVRDRAPRVLNDAEAMTALAGEVLAAKTDGATQRDANPSADDPAGSRDAERRAVGANPSADDPAGSRDAERRAVGANPSADDPAESREAERRADGANPSSDDPAGSRDANANPSADDPAGSRDANPSADDPAGSCAYEDRTLHDAVRLLQYIPSQARWHADELCEVTGLDAGAVLAALSVLELQGTIRGNFTGYYDVIDAA